VLAGRGDASDDPVAPRVDDRDVVAVTVVEDGLHSAALVRDEHAAVGRVVRDAVGVEGTASTPCTPGAGIVSATRRVRTSSASSCPASMCAT
jgi:hypothetical protein